ncbi:MAG TPA: hypothetical protein VFQ35_24325, partial [Polyangiaceae bacterium]|nr:hypothetical protein [Polyangiaceae bacterium]
MASESLRQPVVSTLAHRPAAPLDAHERRATSETVGRLSASGPSSAWLAALPWVAIALVVLAWLPALDAPYQYDDYNTPVGDAASQS